MIIILYSLTFLLIFEFDFEQMSFDPDRLL